MEPARPYDVALCTLCRIFLCPDVDANDPSPGSPLHAMLGEALLREIRRRDEAASPSLIELLRRVQDQVCPHGDEASPEADFFGAVKAAVGQRLALLETPDDLVAFFGALAEGVITSATSAPAEGDDGGADASSALGVYLRMVYARYTAMSFEAICQLLTEVQAYFDAAVAVLQGQPEPEQRPGAALKSAVELERFLADQLTGLPQRAGRATQGELEAPLAELQGSARHLPRTYLARHLASLHHRDFSSALDHLHRFFDYTQAEGGLAGAQPAGAGSLARDEAAARSRLQSAALSLGAMHAQLGHVEEAMQALNETVRIAQQSSDDACLAHALASLCQILDATTPGTITSVSQMPGASPAARHYSQLGQLLRRCLRRSEELQLPHLVAFSRLALARFELLHPQPPPAATDASSNGSGNGSSSSSSADPPCASSVAVSGAARDVAHLHMASCLAAATPAAPPASSGTSTARVLRGVTDLFTTMPPMFAPRMQAMGVQASAAAELERLAGGSHLLQAAAWELRGSRALSQVHALTCLDAFGDVARAEDQATALAQLATSMAAAHGYRAAEQLLAAADERLPAAQSKVLRAARLAIAHERALHRRDLHAAMDIAAQMAALASPTDSIDITLRLEAEERLARTLLASGRTEDAAAAAHKLFAMAAATGQQLHAARLLLLLGRAHREAGAPLAALPYALSCVYHARQLAADLLSCEAAVLMAQLWCDLGAEHAQHAQQELEGALPLILAHGSQELQARAQVALAEALMAKHGTPASLKEDAEWVVSLLGEAERLYQGLEDAQGACHCRYLRALLHDALGNSAERDADAAAALECGAPPLLSDMP